MKREPIIDYYDTEVEVDCVYKSAGKFVYVDVAGSITADGAMVRLTPDQATYLADWLREAAAE